MISENEKKVISGEYLKVECPKCKSILIIKRNNGEVVEVREPLIDNPSGDRFEDAIEKLKNSKKEIEEKFKASTEALKKKKSLDDLL